MSKRFLIVCACNYIAEYEVDAETLEDAEEDARGQFKHEYHYPESVTVIKTEELEDNQELGIKK